MKWKVHQQSYIGASIAEAGQEIEPGYAGLDKKTKRPMHHLPGPHWEPIDDEAKAFAKSLGHNFTGEMPDVDTGMLVALDDAKARMNGPVGGAVIDHEALGETIGLAVAKGLAGGPSQGIDIEALGAAMGAAIAQALPAAIVAASALLAANAAAPAAPAPEAEAKGDGKPTGDKKGGAS